MTDENKRQAIALALGHARAARQAAQALRDLALYNDALSRLYYALFHVMTALLLTEGVEPRRHRALPALLGKRFGHLLDAGDVAAVSRAATYRDLADYERTWHATRVVVDAASAELEPLFDRVMAHLAAAGYGEAR